MKFHLMECHFRSKILDCQYGVHYFKKSCNDTKPARLRLQGTRKIGCLAKITTKKYAIYPEYKIHEDIIGTSREVKQRKKETLEGLRTLLCSDTSTVKTLYKYFVSLQVSMLNHMCYHFRCFETL